MAGLSRDVCFWTVWLLLANLLACSAARAESGGPKTEEVEHKFVVGVGAAAELELGDGSFHPGGNLMIEFEPIEDWLEVEIGASVLATKGGTQVPVDLLLKKPFQLTHRLDFMIGAGPEVVCDSRSPHGLRVGVEGALDLMFWPSQNVGVWFEPSYDVVFHSGLSHGLGSTGGLLIGW
ncbi:MAG TPA: hypothetical protein VF331_11425 [Polyangiales bacterium]